MYNQNQANKFKEQGNIAYKNREYPKAIGLYTKAIQFYPNDPSFYSNRALCYFNLQNYTECINQCDRAISLNSSFGKAYKKKASALAHQLRFSEAVQVLKTALTFDRTDKTLKNQLQEFEHFQSNFNQYQTAERQKDFDAALSCVTYLANKFPGSKPIQKFRIQALAKTGETDAASRLLKTITDSNDPEINYLKGIIQLYGGDSAKARNYFMEGLQKDPDNIKCKQSLQKAKKCQKLKQQGNQLIKSNQYAQAEGKYTEALNLDPFNKKLNSIIYSNRALTFMKRKQNLKALDDLNKSLRLNPNYLKSLIRRAQVSMEQEDYSSAINDYSKIQELDPNSNLKAKIQEAKKKERIAKKKDYYKILGVTKDASEQELKKAYKKLAMVHHPDRNRTKSEAEQQEASKKFKDVAEAYGVLSDKEKKKKYDCGQMDYDGDQFNGMDEQNFTGRMPGGMHGGMPGGTSFTFSSSSGGTDPNDIFKMFFGGGMGGMGGMEGMKGFKNQMNQGSNRNKGNFQQQGFSADDFGGFGGFPGFNNFPNSANQGRGKSYKHSS